jgi:putative endonuclease
MRNDYNFYVYILTNRHHTVFYIGVTDNLQRRAFEHANKLLGGFTAQYNVEKLVYFEHFTDIRFAIAREKQLKGWRRDKKLGLIEGFNPEWKALEETLFEVRNSASHEQREATLCHPERSEEREAF